jgi:hypothetical protein
MHGLIEPQSVGQESQLQKTTIPRAYFSPLALQPEFAPVLPPKHFLVVLF